MADVTITDLARALEAIQAQLANLSRRLDAVEVVKAAPVTPVGLTGTAAAAAPAREAAAEAVSISEEEVLAIAAAIGAFLGVRAHIRQIRLVGSTIWAQEGRVSIQASHRLSAL